MAFFLSVCISYQWEVQHIFADWSLNSPAVSAFLDGYPSAMVRFNFSSFLHCQSSAGSLMDTFLVGWVQELPKGLSSIEEDEWSMSGIWCQPMKERTPLSPCNWPLQSARCPAHLSGLGRCLTTLLCHSLQQGIPVQ